MTNDELRYLIMEVKCAIIDAVRHIGADDQGATHRAAISLGQARDRILALDLRTRDGAPAVVDQGSGGEGQ